MSALVSLFFNNLSPIFLISGSGFLIGKWLQVKPRIFSQVVFYIFSPCLVFKLLVNSQLGLSDFLRMGGFTVALMTLMGILAWLAGQVFRFERRMLVAVILTVTIMNAANYGLPVTLFAFGDDALAHATLFFITVSIMTNTGGILLASMGSSSLKQALVGLLKIPAIYALLLAMLINALGWQVPTPLMRTVDLLGNAAIPCQLVLLGLQVQAARWAGQTLALGVVAALRLLVSPLLAFGLSGIFGLQGLARQAGILEAAMPAAVLTTVLATEFDVEPSFVSVAVFVTTLLSPLTLTPLLAFLGA